MNSIIAADGAPALTPLCCSEPLRLAFDAHDARAHLVDLLLGVVAAVVLARDDVLRARAAAAPTATARAARPADRAWSASGVRSSRPRASFFFLRSACSFSAICLRSASGTSMSASIFSIVSPRSRRKRELVAIARRRLGLGRLLRRLHLEALEIGRAQAAARVRDRPARWPAEQPRAAMAAPEGGGGRAAISDSTGA